MVPVESDGLRRELLRVAWRGFGDLAARLISRHVDQGNCVALLVVSAARIVGHLFPIGARRVAFDRPRSMQHPFASRLVKGATIGSVVDNV